MNRLINILVKCPSCNSAYKIFILKDKIFPFKNIGNCFVCGDLLQTVEMWSSRSFCEYNGIVKKGVSINESSCN